MRFKTLLSIVAALGSGAVVADEGPADRVVVVDGKTSIVAIANEPAAARPVAPRIVYLYGATSMEQLKSANPNHYARAERIIAAADELCKPGPDQVEFVKFDAKEISCQGMLVKLSNPPKREIGFTLDDVRYVALVTLTDSKPEFRQVPDTSK
jgi:hypothetical protein